MHTLIRHLSLVAMSIGMLSGCSDSDNPAKMTQGVDLYAYYCKECHTYRGLGPELQNLPPGVNQLQEHDVILIIKHGYQFGHPMGHFPDLTEHQARAVAEYAVALRHEQRMKALQSLERGAPLEPAGD
jgi:mono/diheme cytochrome c family protein